jgi:hypothetical protein
MPYAAKWGQQEKRERERAASVEGICFADIRDCLHQKSKLLCNAYQSTLLASVSI